MKLKKSLSLVLLTSGITQGDVLVQWLPIPGEATDSEFFRSSQTPAPSLATLGVAGSRIARINQATVTNAGSVWPGEISNRFSPAGEYDAEVGGYTEFTITPPQNGEITFESISYQLNSYGGMNDDDGYTGIVRTSVDNFATELASQTQTNTSSANFLFDISSLGSVTEAITFRIYFVDNAGPDRWADLAAANGGLIVNGTATGTRFENITWTATDSDIWETNGTDSNWNSSDNTFQGSDNVLFDDSPDPAFSGVVEIPTTTFPSSVTFDNSLLDYTLAGKFSSLNGLTKNGSGVATLQVPDNSLPVNGVIQINEGVLELAGNSTAFRNASEVNIAEGGTFRFVSGNAGQDSSVPINLNGGTLDVEDQILYLWPANTVPITLADATTSTIECDGTLYLFGNPIVGTGSLVKTGPGLLRATSSTTGATEILSYTGTTTISEGTFELGGANTAASQSWTVTDGATLRLASDVALPMENLPNSSTVSITGSTLELAGNEETIGSLTLASSPADGASTLTIDDLGTPLAVDELILTGTENYVNFVPAISSNGVYEVMTADSVTGTVGTNLTAYGLSPAVQTWNHDPTTGVISVTIDLAAESNTTLTYSNASGAGEWSLGVETDWLNASSPSQFYNNFEAHLSDVAFSSPGELPITILDTVSPLQTLFSNTAGFDYIVTGNPISGSGGLTINGGGSVSLNSSNFFTGETLISNGSVATLGLAFTTPIPNSSNVTVSGGSTLEIAATNTIVREVIDGRITIDNSTLLQSGGTHSHIGNLTLRNGSTWTATSPLNFDDENAQLNGDVLVEGSGLSQIGPFTSGIGLSDTYYFDVEDVSSDNGPDLIVSAQLEDAAEAVGGVGKARAGTMVLSGVNIYTGPTFVDGGCLLLDGSSAIPAMGALVEVTTDAEFGFIAGSASNSDIVTIANNVTWSGGALTFYVPTGSTASFAGDLTGGAFETATAAITVKGGGTLNFAGSSLPVTPTTDDDSIITGVGVGGTTSIEEVTLTTEPGTNAGRKATLTFSSSGPVDIYTSSDLNLWGAPIAEGITSEQPFVVDDIGATKAFFAIVPAGNTFPESN
ncbi:beta strand repeat-containing protein [Roseibacillus persicicus]|uniref:Uncharacterized protein n=1 Tax=Roseibacillus persicicus TaxID=454148 RepID=A0A918TNE7_9BACT|nr:hypothetical protein [Roseibacillus persicicus]GHC52579.1 hypothetical protein GCM10007100_18620 [Roseibacillus persicicus]